MPKNSWVVFILGLRGASGGALPGPGEGLAVERIVLLRLMPDGRVLEINPATRVAFRDRDLDRYLDRRLDGKRVRELEIQEPAGGCDQIIVIRYEG